MINLKFSSNVLVAIAIIIGYCAFSWAGPGFVSYTCADHVKKSKCKSGFKDLYEDKKKCTLNDIKCGDKIPRPYYPGDTSLNPGYSTGGCWASSPNCQDRIFIEGRETCPFGKRETRTATCNKNKSDIGFKEGCKPYEYIYNCRHSNSAPEPESRPEPQPAGAVR